MTAEKTEKRPSPSRKELKARARAKNKKPNFVRAESWKYDRFSLSWRKPRGLDNKIRRKIKGWPAGPSMGYKGPKIARGLHPSGYREVVVHNAQEVAAVDPNTQAIRIAHTVGKRKRATIIEEANKLNIKLLNFKALPETEKKEEAEEEKSEEKLKEQAEVEKAFEEEPAEEEKTEEAEDEEKEEEKPSKQKKPKKVKQKKTKTEPSLEEGEEEQ